ncbi:von Willebrand factor A domain-containing protein 7 [Scomber japonicus]|uniref:von Willebrand factor A domain-containing protein 7 n=1 Tax=Scomber japonicus TaxID=13676 RepID=UPI0023060551|nr:von Willebrand factor A domain-containing protein 7 [Scomber japonicus]
MSEVGRRRIWQRSGRQMHCFILVYLLLLALPCMGFLPTFWSGVLTLSWDSYTHQYITEQAILNVTLETLGGTEKHQESHADEQTRLGRSFWRSVREVVNSNADMDFLNPQKSNPVYHFDSEHVESATVVLRELWAEILILVQAKNYPIARHRLGQLFHSLQDFYSHSNWVEMGQRSIYLHLLHPEEPAIPVAEKNTPTCMECFSFTCRNNLLPKMISIQKDPQLTTGYFGTSSPKPRGKCSHGGIWDSSHQEEAKGGINKDSTSPLFSPHHYLHVEAATLATEATQTVLRDLRDQVGYKSFLKLFSVKEVPALVFVIDTTGSMGDEIFAARRRAHSIIQRRASTGQPCTYLLVPFHDPGFGPVFKTEDPQQFMQHLTNLEALGGGDEPEMCFSAIQLALTHSLPMSEIFVFTDASPKDAHLIDAVKALTLEKQCTVTFLLTDDQNSTTESRGKGRKRRKKRSETLPLDRFSLYFSLSSLSGGLTVITTNSDIHSVSSIVEDNIAADKVTLLHKESDKALMSPHSFRVDSSIKSVTLHITGILKECILINPLGQTQSLLTEQGPLAELEHFKGLYRIRLLAPIQSGQWNLSTKCEGHITFNVIGDSSIDFLYYFATVTNDTHPGLARVEGSPVAGVSAFLVVAVTGMAPGVEASLNVTLLGTKGESLKRVLLNSSTSSSSPSHSTRELVGWVDSVPEVPFSVKLTGQDSEESKLERVSTEMVQPTHVQIQVLSFPRLVPGHSTVVRFNILNHGPARSFNLTANDDCGYLHTKELPRFRVDAQGSFQGEVHLHTPPTAHAGATVSLTLNVRDLKSPDSNYAVAYLTVVPLDTDTSPPFCFAERVQSSCPPTCNKSNWTISLAVSDRGHSGLAALQLEKGEGTLTLFLNPPPTGERLKEVKRGSDQHQAHRDQTTSGGQDDHHKARIQKGDPPLNVSKWVGSSEPLWLRYTSSCCFAEAELLVWDTAGNMKRCHLTSGEQRQLKGSSTKTSGPRQITLAAFFFLVFGLPWFPLL